VLYLTLKELRAHRGKTQADLADRLRLQQAAVSKLEARSDLYVSMLRSFIEALGGKMEINAVFSDEKLNITGFDNDEVVEALRSLVHQRCRIDPMPPDRIEDEFIVTSVSEDGNVTLEKVSNRQSLEIPVRRILEVLPKNSMSPPTLVLHGSLAWSAQKELWKFMLS
jgi:transcriptional regulator with XRE-family HTH domain